MCVCVCVWSGRGLYDGLITCPEKSYRGCVCLSVIVEPQYEEALSHRAVEPRKTETYNDTEGVNKSSWRKTSTSPITETRPATNTPEPLHLTLPKQQCNEKWIIRHLCRQVEMNWYGRNQCLYHGFVTAGTCCCELALLHQSQWNTRPEPKRRRQHYLFLQTSTLN